MKGTLMFIKSKILIFLLVIFSFYCSQTKITNAQEVQWNDIEICEIYAIVEVDDYQEEKTSEVSSIVLFDKESQSLTIRYLNRVNRGFRSLRKNDQEDWSMRMRQEPIFPVETSIVYVEELQRSMSIIYQSTFIFKPKFDGDGTLVPNYPTCAKIIMHADVFAEKFPDLRQGKSCTLYFTKAGEFVDFKEYIDPKILETNEQSPITYEDVYPSDCPTDVSPPETTSSSAPTDQN
jgi:hypothetical protein